MTRGNQRELDRLKAQKRAAEHANKGKEGDPRWRHEKDSMALKEKQERKAREAAEAAAAGGGAGAKK